MGTDKRDRQKAQRAARIEAERAAEAKAKRNRTIRNMAIVVVVIVAVMVLMGVLQGCSSGGSDTRGGSQGDGCPPEDGVDEPVVDFDAAPRTCIDAGKDYTAMVKTSEGTVALALDTKRTPKTVNNFVVLARYGYFDGTKVFRTEAQTGIIQGGSPHTQDNSDQGPGYTIADEGVPFAAKDYVPGTIAMANSGRPDSGSAQFFFLANDGGKYLADADELGASAGSYVAFGRARKGLDVLEEIAALDDGSGAPSQEVTIEKVTIQES